VEGADVARADDEAGAETGLAALLTGLGAGAFAA
jgi:hypothetical protein